MAALSAHEVEPGLVSYLDQSVLEADPAVLKTAPRQGDLRTGPFLCFAVEGESSSWAPLTGQHRGERLELPREWHDGGGLGWRERLSYLVDGANTYTGPRASFVAASHSERTAATDRARLSTVGVQAVQGEVSRQLHRARPR